MWVSRMRKDISSGIDNVEGREKISGRAQYTSDIRLEGQLYAKTVRATIAHGLIKQIKLPEIPDGYHTVDYTDIPGDNVVNMIESDWPVFAETTVNHIGEPIMLVVGEDKEVINAIIDRIEIRYEPREPEFGFNTSIAKLNFKKGKTKEAFKKADRIIEETYETGYQEQAYIEPQAFIGYPEDEGCTLIGSIQCPYYVKKAVMRTLDVDENAVRVIQAYVGGGFGGKEEFPSLMACQLAVAIKKIGRPIKLVYEREEDMEVTTKRHPAKITMTAAIDAGGKITAIKSHVGLDGGAYLGLSKVVLSRGMLAVTNAYTVANLTVSGDVYKTHTVPNGAFRGFGAPQMIFAIEMFIHHIARSLGEDPFKFRMDHLVRQGDLTATGGVFRDPIIMRDMIAKATDISNYHDKYREYSEKQSNRGIGMSWFLHGCGFTGSGEQDIIKAEVRLKKDTRDIVHILTAAVDMGQGPKTTLKKVVAGVLDIPVENVTFANPDTRYVPDSGPTVASRTMMIVGGLLARAAKKMKSQWVGGQEVVVSEKYAQPDYVKWDQETMQGDAYPAYSWGVNVVEVEVSPITYETRLKNVWTVYDLGKAIDERIVRGQMDGGQAQGLAYGYMEVMNHENGKISQKNLTDYIIPTAVDVAESHNHIMDNPYPLGPYGAKGVGELTLVGGAPAVALAIEQATGQKVNRIPATPESLMELMQDE